MEWTDIPLIDRKNLNKFEGTGRLIYRHGDMQLLARSAADMIIVFDDFKAFFITKQVELNAIRSLAIRRRQRMLDIFIVAHGFTEIVPSFLFTFATKIILFRTLDNLARAKKRLVDYDRVLEAQKRVNAKDEHHFEILNFN